MSITSVLTLLIVAVFCDSCYLLCSLGCFTRDMILVDLLMHDEVTHIAVYTRMSTQRSTMSFTYIRK